MTGRTPDQMAELFRRVADQKLWFDGVDITLQKTGVTYGYQAYKNRLLQKYPETTIDLSLVWKGDTYEFHKKNDGITYTHDLSDPFSDRDDGDIIGGYMIISNRRGEFLTTLNEKDIQKRRGVAKTDSIWSQWSSEMALKTVVKRACSFHFKDDFQDIEEVDNQNYSLEKEIRGGTVATEGQWEKIVEKFEKGEVDAETIRANFDLTYEQEEFLATPQDA